MFHFECAVSVSASPLYGTVHTGKSGNDDDDSDAGSECGEDRTDGEKVTVVKIIRKGAVKDVC